MEPGSWWLKLLWHIPQLPKKKIKLFLKLGDRYQGQGKTHLAKECYERALMLADSVSAVYYIKRIEERFRNDILL